MKTTTRALYRYGICSAAINNAANAPQPWSRLMIDTGDIPEALAPATELGTMITTSRTGQVITWAELSDLPRDSVVVELPDPDASMGTAMTVYDGEAFFLDGARVIYSAENADNTFMVLGALARRA